VPLERISTLEDVLCLNILIKDNHQRAWTGLMIKGKQNTQSKKKAHGKTKIIIG
jgi:hypothetical protein